MAKKKTGGAFDPFKGIPLKPPVRWPKYHARAIDVAGADRGLQALVLQVERHFGGRLRGRLHAGRFIEFEFVADPADVPRVQNTIAYIVEKMKIGQNPFGAMAWVCGRFYIAAPWIEDGHTAWGHVLTESGTETVKQWLGSSYKFHKEG